MSSRPAGIGGGHVWDLEWELTAVPIRILAKGGLAMARVMVRQKAAVLAKCGISLGSTTNVGLQGLPAAQNERWLNVRI